MTLRDVINWSKKNAQLPVKYLTTAASLRRHSAVSDKASLKCERNDHDWVSLYGAETQMHCKETLSLSSSHGDLRIIIHSIKEIDSENIINVIRPLVIKHDQYLSDNNIQYAIPNRVIHITLYSNNSIPDTGTNIGSADLRYNLETGLSKEIFIDIYRFYEVSAEVSNYVLRHELGHGLHFLTTDKRSVFFKLEDGWAILVEQGSMPCPPSDFIQNITRFFHPKSTFADHYIDSPYFINYLYKIDPKGLFDLLGEQCAGFDSSQYAHCSIQYIKKYQRGFSDWANGACARFQAEEINLLTQRTIRSMFNTTPSLSRNSRISLADEMGRKLIFAISRRNLTEFKQLLQAGANPDYQEEGKTILQYLYYYQNCDIQYLEQLLTYKANVTANEKGFSLYALAKKACNPTDLSAIKAIFARFSQGNLNRTITPITSAIPNEWLDQLIAGDLNSVKQAVRNGFKPVGSITEGSTPYILLPIQNGCDWDKYAIINYLLRLDNENLKILDTCLLPPNSASCTTPRDVILIQACSHLFRVPQQHQRPNAAALLSFFDFIQPIDDDFNELNLNFTKTNGNSTVASSISPVVISWRLSQRLAIECSLGLCNGLTPIAVNQLGKQLKQFYPQQMRKIDIFLNYLAHPLLSASINLARIPITGATVFWAEEPAGLLPSICFYFGSNLAFAGVIKGIQALIKHFFGEGKISQAFNFLFYLNTLVMLMSSEDFNENPASALLGYGANLCVSMLVTGIATYAGCMREQHKKNCANHDSSSTNNAKESSSFGNEYSSVSIYSSEETHDQRSQPIERENRPLNSCNRQKENADNMEMRHMLPVTNHAGFFKSKQPLQRLLSNTAHSNPEFS